MRVHVCTVELCCRSKFRRAAKLVLQCSTAANCRLELMRSDPGRGHLVLELPWGAAGRGLVAGEHARNE